MNVENTFNVLKYLPITVTPEYFESLPEDVIDNMYIWCTGKGSRYLPIRNKQEKANYVYALFDTKALTPDERFYINKILTFYIRNSND
jgi:hypothetical protein